MQLTHYTDYGLRVLIFLSMQEEQRVTVSDISEHFDIPRNHLVKVVHRLGQLKYINTTRGKNGGMCLGQATDKIRIGDVVRHMETRLDAVDCNAPSPCPIKSGCQLKSILEKASESFLSVLDQYTIADLQNNQDELKVLLRWQEKVS